MAVSVSVELRNVGKIQKKLMKLAKGTESFDTPLKQSGVYMESAIGQRFRKADWKALSPATIRMHPHRAGGKPLNDTGKLRMSITSQAVKKVSGKKLIYGTNLVYAPLHNFGGKGGWGKTIPKREFLYFDHKDENAIRRIFTDYVKELS